MTARITWLVAAAAALAWAPFVTAPLSPDEGGFLLVASQWRPGHSLYGPYWVDRPPLLITIFDVASHVGGAVALRLIGIAAVLTSVFLAHLLTRRATGRPSAVPVLVAGVFLTTPLFGTGMVNGELLAVPVVLVGLLALVRSWTATRTSCVRLGDPRRHCRCGGPPGQAERHRRGRRRRRAGRAGPAVPELASDCHARRGDGRRDGGDHAAPPGVGGGARH